MPSFFRVFKSAVVGAFFLMLAMQGLGFLANMDIVVSETEPFVPTSPSGFAVAVWAWAGVATWTGTMLGLMYAAPGDAAARASFTKTVRMLVAVWAVFMVFNGVLGVVARPHGLVYFVTANFLVLLTLTLMAGLLARSEPAAMPAGASPAC